MDIAFYAKLYALTIIVFFAIDIFWIGFVANQMYWDNIGHLRSPNTNWVAAILFYTVFIAGIIYFAVRPALIDGNWQTALLNGALLGFLTYCTYDLTNQATLKNWPWKVTIADIIWGILLCGSVATLSFFIGRFLKG